MKTTSTSFQLQMKSTIILLMLLIIYTPGCKSQEFITVKTDKENYLPNEQIQVQLVNDSRDTIYSHFGSYTPIFSIKTIKVLQSDHSWQDLSANCLINNCMVDIDVPVAIAPGISPQLTWTPKYYTTDQDQPIPLTPGTYYLIIEYQPRERDEWKNTTSNVFNIHQN